MAARNNDASTSANVISFMGANYVAKFVGYHMTEGWGQGEAATNAHYQPLDTFAPRFTALLHDIRALGFNTLDIWTAQVNWRWATPEHLRIVQQLLAQQQMQVATLAGDFGDTRQEFARACQIAKALGSKILGGSTSLLLTDRPSTVAILKEYGLKLGIENHPAEKTAHDMLVKIGAGGDGLIGTTIDTGWYGTNNYDAVRTIEELAPYILHIHLKDVRKPGEHETCRYGEGCVDIPGCVAALKRLGYQGAYSIEHEPELFDPSEDCAAMLPMLRSWLA